MTTPSNEPAPPGPGGAPPAPPGPPPPAPPAPPAPPGPPAAGGPAPGEPAEPHWLPSRLQQHERSVLKKLGVESADEVKERLARLKKLEDEEEERKRASMSELEREKAEREKAERENVQLKAEKAEAERQARLTEACLANGVRNIGYAKYLVGEKLRQNPELTESAALEEFLKQDEQRVALGVTAPPATPNPPTTVPSLPSNPGAPPPAPGPNGPSKDATAMSAAEWAAHKRTLGLSR